MVTSEEDAHVPRGINTNQNMAFAFFSEPNRTGTRRVC